MRLAPRWGGFEVTLTVNAAPKPPHFGAGSAYLEDVTAAEFCEERGHGLVPPNLFPEVSSQRLKFRLLKCRIVKRVGHHPDEGTDQNGGTLDKLYEGVQRLLFLIEREVIKNGQGSCRKFLICRCSSDPSRILVQPDHTIAVGNADVGRDSKPFRELYLNHPFLPVTDGSFHHT